jgi:AcrR family transcriptional regulator
LTLPWNRTAAARPGLRLDIWLDHTYRSVSLMSRNSHGVTTRQRILRAAARRFADCGYAAASVQHIVGEARVSKPALYYYFRDKAGLFQALVNEAYDQEYQLMREAAKTGRGIREQLVEILARLFHYYRKNRELLRLALATAFASPGELPKGLRYLDRCERNFEFIHGLMKRALRNGELNRRFVSRELAFGFYGQGNVYIMAHLLVPGGRLDRRTAERIVGLFLAGAAAKRRGD